MDLKNIQDETLQVGNFLIKVPKDHHLRAFMASQRYRFLNIGVSAGFLSKKYPHKVIVDVGANIGDTAAMIASHSKSNLVLIEPCETFFEYLHTNSSLFSNHVTLVKAFISNGEALTGNLMVEQGNAFFASNPKTGQLTRTITLQDTIKAPCSFLKLDTEGFDINIILSSIDWIGLNQCGIFFENHIQTKEDLKRSDELFCHLKKLGYSHFIVWDDPGVFMLATESLEALEDLNKYVFLNNGRGTPRRIYYTDILCLHQKDADIFTKIREYYLGL